MGCVNLEGPDGEGDGREVQKGGDTWVNVLMHDNFLGLPKPSKLDN